MSNLDSETVLLIFAGVVTLALLLQGVALVAIALGARKAMLRATEQIDELRSVVTPVLAESREMVRESRALLTSLGPRIDETTLDLAALIHGLRVQLDELKAPITEITERTRRQAGRLDSMLTETLDAADRAGAFVSGAVAKPIRQLNGILASAKAVVEALRSPAPAVRQPGTNHKPSEPGIVV
jgi:hypothetical protein